MRRLHEAKILVDWQSGMNEVQKPSQNLFSMFSILFGRKYKYAQGDEWGMNV